MGIVFETATSVISLGIRPARCAASAITERTCSILAARCSCVSVCCASIIPFAMPGWMGNVLSCRIRLYARKNALSRSLYKYLAIRYAPVTILPSATGCDSSPRDPGVNEPLLSNGRTEGLLGGWSQALSLRQTLFLLLQ